jgi:hypothetical protein
MKAVRLVMLPLLPNGVGGSHSTSGLGKEGIKEGRIEYIKLY